MGERISGLKNERVCIGGHITLTLIGVFERVARMELHEWNRSTGKETRSKLMLQLEQPHTIAPGISVTLLGFMAAKMGVRLDITAPAGTLIGDEHVLQSRLIAAAIARGMAKRGVRNSAPVGDGTEATDAAEKNP
jgi:hypothetical protein